MIWPLVVAPRLMVRKAVPAGVPFDATALDGVLGFEHQCVFGFEAVVDRGRTREELTHQVEYAVADAGDVDADVLHVEAFAQFFNLAGLVGERVAAPGVFFQDAEFTPPNQSHALTISNRPSSVPALSRTERADILTPRR